MSNKQKIPYFFLVLFIIAFSISPSYTLGDDNRNLLLIVIMCLSPILIIVYNKYRKTDVWILFFMSFIIIFPLLYQPQSMRWSTVLYSCMFCLSFIAYTHLLAISKPLPIQYLKILKTLIFAYFITLLIQQLCILLGLPIFNISNYDPTTPWKLNSLSAEPSHSSRILALLMYCYVTIKELLSNRKYTFKTHFKEDKWVWIAFFWSMITMFSGTAYLFLIIIFFKIFNLKNLKTIFVFIVLIFIITQFLGSTPSVRAYNTLIATLSLDTAAIIEADHSASIRIVPFFVLANMVSLNSLDGWFGHGIDYVSSFLSDFLPGVKDGITGGGMFQVWIEYGFICFALFVAFSLYISYKKGDYISIFFWFMLVFLYGVNNQIVWLCLILLFTNNFFFNKMNNKNKFQNGNP
tara:strand:+ start:7408 stop:8625 length:1218 start_codon:yes stop_codon:yes gene_type:complete